MSEQTTSETDDQESRDVARTLWGGLAPRVEPAPDDTDEPSRQTVRALFNPPHDEN